MVADPAATLNFVRDNEPTVSRSSSLRAGVQSAIASIKTRARGLSDSVRLRQHRKRGPDLNAAHSEQSSAVESAVMRLPPEVVILIMRQLMLRARLGAFYASNSCAWYAQTARAAWSVRYPHILPIARVCRLWHTAATCLLYEAILLLKPTHCSLLARTLRKNPQLASLIRTIALPDLGPDKPSQRATDWTWDNPPSVLPARSVLDHILGQCTNLNNVTIPLGDLQAFPDSNSHLPGWYGRQFIAALLYAISPSQEGGPCARHLTIPAGHPYPFPSFRLRQNSDLARGFASLISLELGMPQLESHLAAIFVEPVTRLSDVEGDGTSFAANAMSVPVRARHPALPALKRLRIWDTTQRLDTIEQLLSQTLVLESLELSWSSCIDVETGSAMVLPFTQRLAPFCGPTLKYLRCVTYNYFGYPVAHGLGDMTAWTNMRWLGIDAQFAIALAEGMDPVHRSSVPPPCLEEMCIFVDTHHRVSSTDSPWTRMVGIVSTVRQLRRKWKTPRLHTIELWGELDEIHQPWHAWSVASFMLGHYLNPNGLKLECYAW